MVHRMSTSVRKKSLVFFDIFSAKMQFYRKCSEKKTLHPGKKAKVQGNIQGMMNVTYTICMLKLQAPLCF